MRGWWRRREAELDAELAAHFRLAVEDRIARGDSAEAALAAARREFGNELLVREATRSQWRGAAVESTAREFLLTLRTLRRNPRFTAVAVLCTALGMGVTMAMFSALHAVLLRPLPYPAAASLVWLQAGHETRVVTGATLSTNMLDEFRQAPTLAELGTWRSSTTDLTDGEALPERVASAQVTANLFALLGAAPLHGRWFDASQETPGGSDVVILGYDVWHSRFGGDPGIVGTTLDIGDRPHVVVGVMPAGFSFPEGARLWTPLQPPPLPPDILFYDGVLATAAPGATLHDVQASIAGIAAALGLQGWNFTASSLRDALTRPLRRPILIFQGAALLVLLLSCANVGALILARSAARRQELAVRAALGAGRGRLARHVLVEAVAVAALGAVLGLAAAWAGVRLLALAFPDGVPSYIELAVHPPVLLLAVALIFAAALLSGFAPALRAGRLRPDEVLAGAARSAGTGGRERGALVVVQLAVSVVLLAAATLLVRSHTALERSLGFDAAGVLTVSVDLPRQRYADAERRIAFDAELRDALVALPGVTAVSASMTAAPLQDGPTGGLWPFRVVGSPAPSPPGERLQRVARHHIAPGYMDVFGVPILAGRDISADDSRAGEATALVNETFATRYFPGGDILGQRIEIEYAENQWGGEARVVGVVRDFRHAAPPAELEPAMYVQHPPGPPRTTFVLRTTLADPSTLAPGVRRLVRDLDPRLTMRIHAQHGVVERAFWQQRLQRNVIGTFALLATALAMFGVYGVLSYTVARRTPEFGVRLALGASARRLLLHVLGDALRLALLGAAIGFVAALALTRLLRGLLYGVEPADPLVLTGAAVSLLVIAAAAALLPAWKASRLDPQTTIRAG